MGRNKYTRENFTFFIFIGLALFPFLFVSCVSRGMVITSIDLTKDSLVIEVDRGGIDRWFSGTLYIEYKNIPVEWPFRPRIQERWDAENGRSIVTLTVDLSNVDFEVFEEEVKIFDTFGFRVIHALYINEEAILTIGVTGGILWADILIEEDKIHILNQGYSSRHPFMR